MVLYEVPLSMSLLGFMWYYIDVKSRFQHAREECESKRSIGFRCLMFSLSGPCELIFLLPLGHEKW